MPSQIQAHLLYAGHAAQLGDTLAFTETWISHNLRPDLPSNEYLPDIGDNPLSGNILSGNSIVMNKLSMLNVKTITEGEYLEGNVRGMIWTVQYDDAVNDAVFTEPTQDEDTVILSISSASQVETYTKNEKDKTIQKLYVKNGGSYIERKNPNITKTISLISVSTTKRYRDKSMQQVIEMGAKAGSVNNAVMWGIPIGCIKYEGQSAAPIQEVDPSDESKTLLSWNVTNNYTIKYIPGITNAPTWDHIWDEGFYSLLYKDDTGSQYMTLYPRDTLPNDIT